MNKEVTLVRGKHCVTLSKESWDLASYAIARLIESRECSDSEGLGELISAIEIIESHGFVDSCIPESQDRQLHTLAH